jgi:hypothetical protein
MDWIRMAQDGVRWRVAVDTNCQPYRHTHNTFRQTTNSAFILYAYCKRCSLFRPYVVIFREATKLNLKPLTIRYVAYYYVS